MNDTVTAIGDRFDFHRLGLLLRGDLIRSYRAIGLAAAAVIALMLVQAVLTGPIEGDRSLVYNGIISLLCFLAAPIVASRAFTELHDKTRNEAYLLLPASAAEKVVVRGLLVTAGYFFATVLLVTVAAWLVLAVKALVFGAVEQSFVPLDALSPGYVGAYFAHQSLYLLGAAWFRRYHFVKTGLSVAVLILAVAWFATFLMRLLLPDFGQMLAQIGFNPWPLLVRIGESFGAFGWLAYALAFVALPVFCWCVAWLRLREAQVSHGV